MYSTSFLAPEQQKGPHRSLLSPTVQEATTLTRTPFACKSCRSRGWRLGFDQKEQSTGQSA